MALSIAVVQITCEGRSVLAQVLQVTPGHICPGMKAGASSFEDSNMGIWR